MGNDGSPEAALASLPGSEVKKPKGPKVLDPSNLCVRCEVKDGTRPHRCPIANVRDDDSKIQCNCCAACESKCAMDVKRTWPITQVQAYPEWARRYGYDT